MKPAHRLRESLAQNHRSLAFGRASEEDVVNHLVAPVLDHLGYTAATTRHQYHIGRRKADAALWPNEDAMRWQPPAVILEAKKLGANFDGGPSLTSTPLRQIEGYMVSAESRGDVLGVLTDGVRWRVLRRTGSVNVEALGEWSVIEDPKAIDEIAKLIGRKSDSVQALAAAPRRAAGKKRWKKALDILAEDVAPRALFGALALDGEVRNDMTPNGDMQAALAQARGDWLSVAWTRGPQVESDQQDLFPADNAAVIVGYAEVRSAARDDVHVLLRSLAARSTAGASACLVSHRTAGDVKTVRVGVHRGGRTSVGEPFDAEIPNDKAAAVMNRLYNLTSQAKVAEKRIEDVVSNIDVHKAFFDQIRRWVARQMKGKTRRERSAILRHLLRCVFLWSIRERIGIPDCVFHSLWWRRLRRGSYHKHLVRFLFHDRLNKRRNRPRHSVEAVQDALRSVRYLNGSLFAQQDGDSALTLSDADYFGHKEGREGLWTIFAAHRWTTQEEDAEVREQSVDPKMLGGLFENLMATVETGSTANLLERMPGGTYYTPVDLVWEMTKDALTERLLAAELPQDWSRKAVTALFADGSLPKKGRKTVARELASLTVFDPAVGSGEFLLGITKAIGRGLAKLGAAHLARTRRIVEEQIHGQDVNALAASVARLRLFIAIEDDEVELAGERPLPNLEAKVVCADSIGTEIRHEGTASFSAADPTVIAALSKCQEIQDQFLLTHGSRKDKLRTARRNAGAELKAALKRTMGTHGSLEAFAEHDYLDQGNETPVMTDPRWTFGSHAARGFDVVIGNPPYVGLRGMKPGIRDALSKNAKRNGYRKFDDLYMPFCEGALELAKPQKGTVCLVVPLSLSFASQKASIRNAYVSACSRIMVRHQDNRPDTTFGHSPVEHGENRQRTTIVLAVRGDEKCRFATSGLGRWPKALRHRYLRLRPRVAWSERTVTKKLPTECQGQWPRIATAEGARILREVIVRGAPAAYRGTAAIGLPKSAMYFVTVAPAGLLDRGEEHLACDERSIDVFLALLNSGVAYLWWKAWGDGFHVKAATYAALPDLRALIPPNRLADLGDFGTALRQKLEHGKRRVTQSGTGGGRQTENMNLWETAAELLDEIDDLILMGLGLSGSRYKVALAVERSRYALDQRR